MIHSGLGNQMFMYATGRALALRMNASLFLDISRFPADLKYFRTYDLDQLPIKARVVNGGPISSLLPLRVRLKAERTFRGPFIRNMCGFITEESEGPWVRFEPRLLEPATRGSVVISGYWQSERYFADHAETIRKELMPARTDHPVAVIDRQQIENSEHPVAICVRFHMDAPGQVANHVGIISAFRRVVLEHAANNPRATYFLFTDQPAFFSDPQCLGTPFRIISHFPGKDTSRITLYSMTRCRDFILTFSSFHWWGAWLSPAPAKRVIYLRFNGLDRPNHIPESWVTRDVQDS